MYTRDSQGCELYGCQIQRDAVGLWRNRARKGASLHGGLFPPPTSIQECPGGG